MTDRHRSVALVADARLTKQPPSWNVEGRVSNEMDHDATEWLARWNGIASRDGLTLAVDGDRWRLDPLPTAGMMTEPETITVSDEVRRLPDGRVVTRRMTREEVEAFFGPDDGPI